MKSANFLKIIFILFKEKMLTVKAIIKSSKRSLEYIYFACLGVCLFVSNRRQNAINDRAQILCGTYHGPEKVYE